MTRSHDYYTHLFPLICAGEGSSNVFTEGGQNPGVPVSTGEGCGLIVMYERRCGLIGMYGRRVWFNRYGHTGAIVMFSYRSYRFPYWLL